MAKKSNNEMLINNPDILFKYSVDMLVITVSLLLAGMYINGFNALRLALWSVISSTVCEDIACRIMKRTDRKANDLYAAVTGLAIALMLPATTPAYIAVSGCLFAVLVILVPFGSGRKVPFVPAAAGICFITVCFPEATFAYPAVNIGVSSPLFGADGFALGESFTKMLTYGESVIFNSLEAVSVLVGKTVGPMGTTCMLALAGCGVYLLLKRKDSFVISIAFLASCAGFAALFPRVNSGAYSSVVMELSAGTLVFTALVLLPNPFTSPRTLSGRISYGIFSGVLCMLLRRYGAYEESVCFAVLIMNAAAPAVGYYFDMFKENLVEKGIIKKKTPKFTETPKDEKKKAKPSFSEKSEKIKAEKEKIRADKIKAKEEKYKSDRIEREAEKAEKLRLKEEKETEKITQKKSDQKKRAEKSRIKREAERASKEVTASKRYSIDSFSYESLMNFDDETQTQTQEDMKEGENNG